MIFEVEEWKKAQCRHDDIWPCKPAVPGQKEMPRLAFLQELSKYV